MKVRSKMSVANRAKQFMPFSALPGLDEALARVEQAMEHSGDAVYRVPTAEDSGYHPHASDEEFDLYNYYSAEDESSDSE